MAKIVADAATDNGITLPPSLTEEERKMVVVLSLLRGRWHRGSETTLAARTGIAVPPLMDMLREALAKGLIINTGRLTDSGYAFLEAGGAYERQTPIIATVQKPYYPEALRIPR